MQSIIDIKNRMKSVRDTAQITKAMEMISVAKMRKANEKFARNAAYFSRVRHTMKDIMVHSDAFLEHPYFSQRNMRRTAFVVVASDNGLAGDYNHKVLDYAWNIIENMQEDKYIFTIGHMAQEYFMRKGMEPDVEFLYCAQDPTLQDARLITADLVDLYDRDIIDDVVLIYTRQEGASAKPIAYQLLPISRESIEDAAGEAEYAAILEFEPSPKRVFDILAPQYVVGLVYSCLISAICCEHTERMRTMNSATDNAQEMMEKLELEYHRARQAEITTEITEISAANRKM